MIFDTLSNIDLYKGISKRLDTAIEFLKTADFSKTEPGRYEIDGDDVYYMLQTPNLKKAADAQWEMHKNYIDIQLALRDGEAIGWENAARVRDWGAYNPENDCTVCPIANAKGQILPLHANDFAILFPDDAHAPCIALDFAKDTRKIVAKVRV